MILPYFSEKEKEIQEYSEKFAEQIDRKGKKRPITLYDLVTYHDSTVSTKANVRGGNVKTWGKEAYRQYVIAIDPVERLRKNVPQKAYKQATRHIDFSYQALGRERHIRELQMLATKGKDLKVAIVQGLWKHHHHSLIEYFFYHNLYESGYTIIPHPKETSTHTGAKRTSNSEKWMSRLIVNPSGGIKDIDFKNYYHALSNISGDNKGLVLVIDVDFQKCKEWNRTKIRNVHACIEQILEHKKDHETQSLQERYQSIFIFINLILSAPQKNGKFIRYLKTENAIEKYQKSKLPSLHKALKTNAKISADILRTKWLPKISKDQIEKHMTAREFEKIQGDNIWTGHPSSLYMYDIERLYETHILT